MNHSRSHHALTHRSPLFRPFAVGAGALATCALMLAGAPAATAAEDDDRGQGRQGARLLDIAYVGARLVPTAEGATVAHVDEGGPVDDAGIAEGDIVVSIDGIEVDTRGALRDALADAEAGTELSIAYVHAGKAATATVTVGAPEDRPAPRAPEDVPWVGASLVHYSAAEGVLVRSVEADGPADAAGLEKGDVVTSINGTSVTEWYQVQEILRDLAPGDKATVEVERDGDTTTVTLTLGSLADASPRPMGEGTRDGEAPRDGGGRMGGEGRGARAAEAQGA